MGMTNWSKAERLPMEQRLGMANRLMDRVGYETIRVWLSGQGIETDEMPSDKAMRAYMESAEYEELRQQRLWAMPEFGGEGNTDGAVPGALATGLFAADAPPESRRAFLERRLRGLQARLMTADAVQRRYDRVADAADLCEGVLLTRVEETLNLAADAEEGTPESMPWALPSDPAAEEEPTDLEELMAKGYLKSVAVAIRRSPLLYLASRMPETDPMWLSAHACRIARREQLRRDPRLLGPAAYLRSIRETLKIYDALATLPPDAPAPTPPSPTSRPDAATTTPTPAATTTSPATAAVSAAPVPGVPAPSSAASAGASDTASAAKPAPRSHGSEAGTTDSAGFSPHSAGFGHLGALARGIAELDLALDYDDADDDDLDDEGYDDDDAEFEAYDDAELKRYPSIAEVNELEASGILPAALAGMMRAELQAMAAEQGSAAKARRPT